MVESSLRQVREQVFPCLWKNLAWSKVLAFSWKLLLDRIPSRVNLAKRNVLDPDSSLNCLCAHAEEALLHLLRCGPRFGVRSVLIKSLLLICFCERCV